MFDKCARMKQCAKQNMKSKALHLMAVKCDTKNHICHRSVCIRTNWKTCDVYRDDRCEISWNRKMLRFCLVRLGSSMARYSFAKWLCFPSLFRRLCFNWHKIQERTKTSVFFFREIWYFDSFNSTVASFEASFRCVLLTISVSVSIRRMRTRSSLASFDTRFAIQSSTQMFAI